MIKDRNWQVDLWNGKGVVMGFVRCYLRSFALIAADFGSDMDFPFGLRIWLGTRHSCLGAVIFSYFFLHCHFGIVGCRIVV